MAIKAVGPPTAVNFGLKSRVDGQKKSVMKFWPIFQRIAEIYQERALC